MLEMLAPGVIYSALKDFTKFTASMRKKKLTSEERIALRDKWKPIFEKWVLDQLQSQRRSDIFIRDVARFDLYPDTGPKKRKGISPWFRLGLMDTYHGGILVGLHWQRLIELDEGTFRVAKQEEYENGQDPGIKVNLAARIPYHQIQSVDFEGDEYYGFPHIFCHFSLKGSPYESIEFYERRQLEEFSKPYFVQIGEYRKIEKESKKVGIKYI